MFMVWIWLALAVFFLFAELATSEFVAVWFTGAALVLSIVSAVFVDFPIIWQVVTFVVISAVLVASTRPLVKKLMKRGKERETNLELVVGHNGIVTKEINNNLEQGEIKINGLIWTARSQSGELIPQDVLVIVRSIQGNKLIVEKFTNQQEVQ